MIEIKKQNGDSIFILPNMHNCKTWTIALGLGPLFMNVPFFIFLFMSVSLEIYLFCSFYFHLFVYMFQYLSHFCFTHSLCTLCLSYLLSLSSTFVSLSVCKLCFIFYHRQTKLTKKAFPPQSVIHSFYPRDSFSINRFWASQQLLALLYFCHLWIIT